MAKVTKRWRGQWYIRESGRNAPNWRNRQTGVIVKTIPKPIRGRVIVKDGINFIGVERTGRHFFFSDPKKSVKAKGVFEKKVRSAAERRAMFSKMKGRR